MSFGYLQVDSRTDHARCSQSIKLYNHVILVPRLLREQESVAHLSPFLSLAHFFVEGSSPPFASVQTTLS